MSVAPTQRKLMLLEYPGARYVAIDGAVWLQAENPAYPDLQIADGQTLEVWGVITRSIRML